MPEDPRKNPREVNSDAEVTPRVQRINPRQVDAADAEQTQRAQRTPAGALMWLSMTKRRGRF
jgi:hypothetical protein